MAIKIGNVVVIDNDKCANLSQLDVTGVANMTGATFIGGQLDVKQDIVAFTDVTTASDARLKSNIEKIEGATDKVNSLNGYTYDRVDVDRRQAGVIAQEVLEVLPESVKERDDGMLSVCYSQLIPLLIEAIKEQDKRIKELESKEG